jgi:hypothetical protein
MKLPAMPAPFGALKPINQPSIAEVFKAAKAVEEAPKPEAPKPVVEAPEAPPSVQDAISYIYAKTIEQLAAETKQPKRLVKKEIDRLWNSDYLEERNGHYRYQNTAAWKVSSQ